MVGYIHSLAGKKKLLVQFKDFHKKEISSSSLLYLSLKEEVEMDEAISHSTGKEQGELLTIVGNPNFGEPCMFVTGMYLSILYCLCYVKYIYTDMSEDQVV